MSACGKTCAASLFPGGATIVPVPGGGWLFVTAIVAASPAGDESTRYRLPHRVQRAARIQRLMAEEAARDWPAIQQ